MATVNQTRKTAHKSHSKSPLRLSLKTADRKRIAATLDVSILTIGLLYYTMLQSGSPSFTAVLFERPYQLVSYFILWVLFSSLFSPYDVIRASHPLTSSWAIGKTVVCTTLVALAIPYIGLPLPNSRTELLFPLMLMSLALIVWRVILAGIFARSEFNHRVLVVGAGYAGETIAQAIEQWGERDALGQGKRAIGYTLLGFIDDDPEKLGNVISSAPVLGDRQSLLDHATNLQPDEIVLAIQDVDTIDPALFKAILSCREGGLSVVTMPTFYESLTGQIAVEHIGRNLIALLPTERTIGYRLYLIIQRLMDIAIGLIGCLILLVAMPIVWLFNRFTDPGDLFYRQTRVGLGGKAFQVIKFRSMIMDAEKFSGAVWATEDDPRITRIGRFIRKTRVDEIPQFWNVLKGEMSIVGPRPERPHFVEQLSDNIPYYKLRHAVKPGITGWAQVKYRYGASEEDSLIKLKYDLFYIKRQSLYLDVLTLLKTIQVVIGMQGR